jgi:hypothetical protein
MNEQSLSDFARKYKFSGKGPLSVALMVTDHARKHGLPIDPDDLLTDGGGQVKGLTPSRIQSILAKYNITRELSREAGRTSRGSIQRMQQYVAFLNNWHSQVPVDFDLVENFWIAEVQRHFAGKPFRISFDGSVNLRSVVGDLLRQAKDRQAKSAGTMFHGTVMQHLVGAKLAIVLGEDSVTHHSANTSDQDPSRKGDFDVGDVSIHVTVSPSEALIKKCEENIRDGVKPLIVTGEKGLAVAEGLAHNLGLQNRVELIEFEQFIATNIYEMSGFESLRRKVSLTDLVEIYNQIVSSVETDPSLRIEMSGKI